MKSYYISKDKIKKDKEYFDRCIFFCEKDGKYTKQYMSLDTNTAYGGYSKNPITKEEFEKNEKLKVKKVVSRTYNEYTGMYY